MIGDGEFFVQLVLSRVIGKEVMKTLFVGTTNYDCTGWSKFFRELLQELSTNVDIVIAEASGDSANNGTAFQHALTGNYDLVVCWQCEHIAEQLLPFHRNIVLVPMWEAARHRSTEYWARFCTIPIVSFSRDLHEMLLRNGCDSHYFQYFPEVPIEQINPHDPDVWGRGFFWEKYPNEPWNAKAVAEIANRLGLRHLHIHRVPDYGNPTEVTGFAGHLTSSSSYLALKGQFGIFFAPRDFEGIGDELLEGLALGQLVVSPDQSTASDYIVSAVNGLLLGDRPTHQPDPSAYPQLGQAARRFMIEGRRIWTADVQRLKRLLVGTRMRTRFREALDVSACRPFVRQGDAGREDSAHSFPEGKSVSAAPPFLSVITVIRNAADQLYETLRSLNDQTFKDFEVLIGDSFSTDEPEAVIAEFGLMKVRHIRIDDSGIYDGMNKTVDFARGEYVYFLNAGDLLYDTHVLQRLRDAVGDGRPALCLGSHIYTTSDKVVEFHKVRHVHDTIDDLREGRIDNTWFLGFPSHQATFTLRSVLISTPYDTRFRIASDHDFLLKTTVAGHEVLMLDFVIACYAGGGFSSQHANLCWAEWHIIYHKFTARPDRIDDFFSRGNGERLGPYNPHTGVPLAGLLEEKEPEPNFGMSEKFRRVSNEGLQIFIPSPLKEAEYEISGYLGSHSPEFIVSFTVNGQKIRRRCRASGEKYTPFRLLVPIPADCWPAHFLVETLGPISDSSFLFRSLSLHLVAPGDGGVLRVRQNEVPVDAFMIPGPDFHLDRPKRLSSTGLQIQSYETNLVCRPARPDCDLRLSLASSSPCIVEISLPGRTISSERFVGETVVSVPCSGSSLGEIVFSIRAREGMPFGLGDTELRGIGHYATSDHCLNVGETYPATSGGILSNCLGIEWHPTEFEHRILTESAGFLRFRLARRSSSPSVCLLLYSRDELGIPAPSELAIHVNNREPIFATVGGGKADWIRVPDISPEIWGQEIVICVENLTEARQLLLFSVQLNNH
jgi:glycosyltransferase involved in cell wall biosynthesis